MGVTRAELRGYCRPFFQRKSFSFRSLKGLVEPGVLGNLHLAKAFANPGKDNALLLRELRNAHEDLRAPLISIFDRLRSNPSSPYIHLESLMELHKVFLENSVYAPFTPSSNVGYLVLSRDIESLRTFFYLGEMPGTSRDRSNVILSPHVDGNLEVNISENAAMLMAQLEMWLAAGADLRKRADLLPVALSQIPPASLENLLQEPLEKLRESGAQIPAREALYISCLRHIFSKFEAFCRRSKSPREFLNLAMNQQLDSALAHVMAVLEEGVANDRLNLPFHVSKIMVHLLHATYADPAMAFHAMLADGFDITGAVADFGNAIRQHGVRSFSLKRVFLKRWARKMLDAIFAHIHEGKRHWEVLGTDSISRSQTSDFIEMGQMPLIECALCNPGHYAE